MTDLIAAPALSVLVAVSRWRQPSGIWGIMKEPNTGTFNSTVSLLATAEDLEFIFQQVSHPEYTLVLTLQWFQYSNVRGVM